MEIRKFFKETLLKISIKSWFHLVRKDVENEFRRKY